MADICISVPQMEAHKVIEVEVKVNGAKKRYNYRVALFARDSTTGTAMERVQFLQEMIAAYDPRRQLYQIGAPTPKHIPVMFRQVG